MGEIAEAMISGELCAMCGVSLECDDCADMGIPIYCSIECAKDQGAGIEQVCNKSIEKTEDL